MEKNDSPIGILGFGEVGQAIGKFYQNPRIKDLQRNDGLEGIEIFHICIPWSEGFIDIVEREVKTFRPKLTIIHSTVAPGTTRKLVLSLPKTLGDMVVHSPVRGVHPNLYEGIKTFIKYIGADNKKAGERARRHLESLGMKVKVCMPSVTTEIGKLLDTTYYGLCIAWHGEMKKICERLGVDFQDAVADFNVNYNEGYTKLGKSNVVRPVLEPPDERIGGHCIIPNVEILKRFFQSEALELIWKYRPRHYNKNP